MFQKLITNLPFNPSLINQVSFYAKRIKQEESLRRIGLIFVVLAMFIQMFAVIAPPEPTLAASSNDIIRGGFANVQQATLHCLNNASDFPKILNHYGISCDNIAKARTVTIRSTDHGGQLYSMGRHARGPVGKNNKPTDEYAVNIAGNTYYMRRLASFDSGASSTYKALSGTTANGTPFLVLYNCGNIVLVGRNQTPPPQKAPAPTPPPPPTMSTIPKTNNSSCEVTSVPGVINKGESFSATIRVKNSGTTSWDPSAGYTIGSEDPRDNMNWGTNRVSLPKAVSPSSSLDINASFVAPSSPGTYQFSWQMLQTGVEWFGSSCAKPVTVVVPKIPPPTDACTDIPGNQQDSSECAPCEESETNTDVASCLVLAKTASNDTQAIKDANGTTANAGDQITYTLSVTNKGKVEMKDFVFDEILVDVLEYADLQTNEGAKFNKETGTLTWQSVNIQPGETVQKAFVVKVKPSIPETPKSASDPTSYDLTMTNVFHGVTVNIHLPPGVGKTTEQVVTTLPSTGPGTSVIIGFFLTSIVAYFFARSRLIGKELEIIRTDFAQTGGV